MNELETKVVVDKLVSIEEAAQIFGVKVVTFRKWLYRNKLPKGTALKIGNTIRIRTNVLAQLINGEV